MTSPFVELRSVTIQRDRQTILDIDDLTIEEQSTLAVLGQNGAGKSTLLRAVGGLIEPTEGSILLDGRPSTAGERRRVIAAVLQRPLLRRGTVSANVHAGMRFRGISHDQRQTRAEHWLRRLGMTNLAAQDAHRLSGGQAQRTSLARALALQPRLLLLDEPFTSLDIATKSELLADLRAAIETENQTALFVTHDRHEASVLADRIVILHHGEILQHGPTEWVYDHPANVIAAELLGYRNQIPAALLPVQFSPQGTTLVVRPADLIVVPDSAEPLLEAQFVRPTIDGDVPSVVARIGTLEVTARLARRPMPAPGDMIRLQADPERIRWC